MKKGLKLSIKVNKPYFLTTTVEGWIDVFTRKALCDILVDSLRYCIREKGLNIFAFVIMSNHLHMVASCDEPSQLDDTIRDFKKFTSKACVKHISSSSESRKEWMLKLFADYALKSKRHKSFKFWQTGNHVIELSDAQFTWQKINYIHQNPVRAGLVRNLEDWIYSSASNYMDMESIIPEVITITPYLNYK